MLSEIQYDEIIELISLKQEGSHWDFKKEWYGESKNADLLHDIICMANNLDNRDAYIIIGVDEENDYCINDMSKSSNRKNTQKLVDFLRDKKFVGGIRPQVLVENMQLEEGTIDVIIVKNGFHTPYFLEEKYRDVNANNIYTRVFDTNTPKNKSADILHIEYLWKKRFRLLSSPAESVFFYLLKKDDWLDVQGDSCVSSKYYKYSPEFVIEHSYCEDRNGYEYYLFSQTDSTPHWYNINVKYHQTVLYSTIGVSLDGGRYFTNVPQTGSLYENCWRNNVFFKYFIKRTPEMVLHDFFYEGRNYEEVIARDKFEECILIFYSAEEMKDFKNYAASKWAERDKYLENLHIPYIPIPEGYRENAFKEDYENALVLKRMLDEYRTY